MSEQSPPSQQENSLPYAFRQVVFGGGFTDIKPAQETLPPNVQLAALREKMRAGIIAGLGNSDVPDGFLRDARSFLSSSPVELKGRTQFGLNDIIGAIQKDRKLQQPRSQPDITILG